MKTTKDLEQFKNVLPYSSELFGVYQPLLGWKSKRILFRFKAGLLADKRNFRKDAFRTIQGDVEFKEDIELRRTVAAEGNINDTPIVAKINIGNLNNVRTNRESFLLDTLSAQLPDDEEQFVETMDSILNPENLQKALNNIVTTEFDRVYQNSGLVSRRGETNLYQDAANQANKESRIAGYILELKEKKDVASLKKMFYGEKHYLKALLALIEKTDPFDIIDPKQQIDRVIVSPISIVHLFRQYFFEFDTFLGSPVEHVWLSPGSNVELLETSTRKKIVEKQFQSEFETITTVAEELEELDEISDSVTKDNQNNTKFGFNGSVEQGWVGGSAKASSSLNIDTTQKTAREKTHRHMRQQSKKLSSKIRKNYKSSFKTVTEVVDTSSKRYLLNNTTNQLINYELRRKMRQIGVQVQDIGTYLCWQTYVDDPGKGLGIAELVHIAKPSDLEDTPNPDAIAYPEKISSELPIDIPFKPRTSDTNSDDMDENYHHGVEVDTDTNEGTPEKIDANFGGFSIYCEQPGYKFESLKIDNSGNDIQVRVDDLKAELEGSANTTSKVSFGIHLTHVNFRDQSPLRILAKVVWVPTDEILNKIDTENSNNLAALQEAKKRAFKEAYLNAARERIKLASEVESRKFEDLREEERIVIYRALIQDMLTKDVPLKDDRTRHAVAELLNSIFDIDKMLYFVAPEWWRPRLHRSGQTLGEFKQPPTYSPKSGSSGKNGIYTVAKEHLKHFTSAPQQAYIPEESKVGWGGMKEHGRDNYYITEDSKPAKLGSSLGWLLQLDGDNLRNTFLNSPWVKAVIPIRPGKEKAAFNWLQQVNVEGSDGLDSEYIAPAAELAEIPHSGSKVTLRDAINHLCKQVKEKHKSATQTGLYPVEEINDDNKVSATPIDKVYEHGFYPNQGGFKIDVQEPFEVFDQWIEIMPTDQIVPVEVEYDPKTGRQV